MSIILSELPEEEEKSSPKEEHNVKNEAKPSVLSLSAEMEQNIADIARDLNSNDLVSNSYEITDIFKQHGLPIRCLGALRSMAEKPRLKALIVVEMVSVAWTRQLFDDLQSKPPHFVSLLLKKLNLLLGLDPESKAYYDGELTDQVRSFFDLDANLVSKQSLTNSRETVFLSLSKVVNGAMYFQLQKSISKHANLNFTSQFRNKLNEAFKQNESKRKPIIRDSLLKSSSSSQLSNSLKDSYLPQEALSEKDKEESRIQILDIEEESLKDMASAFEIDQEDEIEKEIQKAKREHSKKEGSFSSLLKNEKKEVPNVRNSTIGFDRNSSLNISNKDLKKDLDLDDFEIVISDPDSPTPKQQLEDVKRIKKQLGLGVSKIRDSIIQFIDEV
eukprot:TRINITY_DN3822_c0_g1_i1.p1 TRINITY_DN3822_c0_g1~~TRINITY_DN3822_c0_g1_i1.p1  ORF type:complete len:387 (+),score=142.05 TRINITY_DN3822_c0_g1_i1:126-1286(+)